MSKINQKMEMFETSSRHLSTFDLVRVPSIVAFSIQLSKLISQRSFHFIECLKLTRFVCMSFYVQNGAKKRKKIDRERDRKKTPKRLKFKTMSSLIPIQYIKSGCLRLISFYSFAMVINVWLCLHCP